jgi:hypothetical protein
MVENLVTGVEEEEEKVEDDVGWPCEEGDIVVDSPRTRTTPETAMLMRT